MNYYVTIIFNRTNFERKHRSYLSEDVNTRDTSRTLISNGCVKEEPQAAKTMMPPGQLFPAELVL